MKLSLTGILVGTLLSCSPVFAQDDVLEKIRQLEQQIQELKLLKEQQNISAKKAEDCMTVVSRQKYCDCVGLNLPADVSFEHYVHSLLLPRDKSASSGSPSDLKISNGTATAVRDKCIEKGFFK